MKFEIFVQQSLSLLTSKLALLRKNYKNSYRRYFFYFSKFRYDSSGHSRFLCPFDKNSLYITYMYYVLFNSQAGGMAIGRPYGFKIDLWETVFLDQLQNISLLSLNSFLHPFLNSKFMKKNVLAPKKNLIFTHCFDSQIQKRYGSDQQCRQHLTPLALE